MGRRSNTLGSRLGRVFGGKAGLDFKLSRSEFFTQLGSSIYKGQSLCSYLTIPH